MKIEKAIEILEDGLRFVEPGDSPDKPDAVQLGIEALKVIKELRHYPFPDGIVQLPGETKE